MFETFSIETLQVYWWIIISILGSLFVFLLFIQGGQTLTYAIGKTEPGRKMLVNALGRKWGFTFTSLVTFGCVFFAAFPIFCSTSFGGASWVWMAIVFSFIIQAVAFEFRVNPINLPGARVHEWFLIVNGLVGTVLLGTVIGTFFTGSEFIVNKPALSNLADPAGSRWMNPAHGLEALLKWQNASLGLALFFLARLLGTLYFMKTVDDEEILTRSKKQLFYNAIPFLLCFLVFLYGLLIRPGFAVRPYDGSIYGEMNKYYHNLVQMPIVLMILASGVVFVLLGVALPLTDTSKNAGSGIWYAGTGAFLTIFALFCVAGLNNTAYYPSVSNIQSSLTIRNSSSSLLTLTVMSYVSLLVPIAIACIWYTRRATKNKKIDAQEKD